ncbi:MULTISPECIES: EutP/PduV family microcompartment system protein [Brevibacillus]|uniref:EutP/PduV family microcompartment system protein n=1 Tax=Brevibacillus TaxID=55080 RepID=UPI000E2F8753|nr:MULTISPECIES: EutP/PduV family microcompartment system protein [Brevibacillus]MCG7317493.1 EutP/PduV family microcompartment system protein [Brevibacillus laterosporus]MED1789021.1 EutP/PduV family microcompartment system protein [Brevibacillus laterosporus]RFB34836.1 ethanolamine utilization protein EutP [Brevibacillus sp. VP]
MGKIMMLVGRTGCGKTTLTQALMNTELSYRKTQMIETVENIIDTPGEYIENRNYYRALIVTSAECDLIGFVQACTDQASLFPVQFASAFAKPVIGIVTKVDRCNQAEELTRAERFLREAGAEQIFHVSSYEKQGLEKIKDLLARNT